MLDQHKTKAQLIEELVEMRARLAGCDRLEGGQERKGDAFSRNTEFERLISEITSDFVDASEAHVGIEAALDRIARFVKAEHAYIFLFDGSDTRVDNVHEWCGEGTELLFNHCKGVSLNEHFSCFAEHLRKHEVFYVPDVDSFPSNGSGVSEYLRANQIRSMIIIPMVLTGRLVGFLGCHSAHALHARRVYDHTLLRFCGESFANALVRRRTEESLRASEYKYRRLYETVPESIIVVDRDGYITGVNPYHLSSLGRGHTVEEDYLGINVLHFPSIVDAGMADAFKQVLEGQTIERMEVYYPYTSGGGDGWFNIRGVPLLKDDEVIGAVYVHEDITARKQAEEYIRAIADYTYDWESWLDPKGRLKWVNPAVEKMSGYTVEDCEDMIEYPLPLVHEEHRMEFQLLLQEALEKESSLSSHDVRVVCKSGEIRWMAVSWQAIYDTREAYLGLRVSMRDVTERKRIAEEHIRAIADYSYDWESWLAPDGCLKWVNPAVEKMTGYTVEDCREMVDYPLSIVHEEQRAEFQERLQRALTERSSLNDYDFLTVGKHRRARWLSISWQAIYDSEGVYLGLRTSVHDITERRSAEDFRRQQEDVMRRTEKMVTLGTLVAGVAHEINNPNNVIMLNAPFISQAWNDACPFLRDLAERGELKELAGLTADEMLEEVPHLLDGILRSGDRIKRIVTQLKDYARESSSSPHMTLVEVNEVLRSAMELVHNRMKNATQSLHVDLAAGVPRVRGDFYQLEQVFINLLLNACDAVEDGGHGIWITTSWQRGKGAVEIRVRDEGSGMSAEVMEHIMDPFFSTKQDREGTGLGLSISMRIIEEHKGALTYQSQLGEGTTAIVLLKTEEGL